MRFLFLCLCGGRWYKSIYDLENWGYMEQGLPHYGIFFFGGEQQTNNQIFLGV
jgi:hypothetical protein